MIAHSHLTTLNFSLLAGGADGYIVIYDVNSVPGREKERFASVGTVALNNRHRHNFSVETVNWYPLDTGMFTSSGTDCLLKIWDTNRLKVRPLASHTMYYSLFLCSVYSC